MSAPNSPKRRHRRKEHHPVDVCARSGKHRHRSRKIALTKLNRLRALATKSAQRSMPCAVYQCRWCGDWHLTSREQTP